MTYEVKTIFRSREDAMEFYSLLCRNVPEVYGDDFAKEVGFSICKYGEWSYPISRDDFGTYTTPNSYTAQVDGMPVIRFPSDGGENPSWDDVVGSK